MKTPYHRFLLGASTLFAVIVVAVIVYRLSHPEIFDWVDAVWFAVVTVSSVGFGERSQLSTGLQLFTVGVIVIGMSAAAYTLGGLIQMMTEGEIQRAVGRRRITRGIEKLKGHVVVCGYGRTGSILARELEQHKRPFVVVDIDPDRVEQAVAEGCLVVTGDATEEHILQSASIERAGSLVSVLPSDADNVFITLTSRNLNPDLQIVARAEYASSEKKLLQAGADRVVMPANIGALRMARMITRPTTAHLMELFAGRSTLEVEMDEITISPESKLVGMTVVAAEAHRRHSLLVVAVQQADGDLFINPGGDYTFEGDDTIIVMGRPDDIGRFRERYGL